MMRGAGSKRPTPVQLLVVLIVVTLQGCVVEGHRTMPGDNNVMVPTMGARGHRCCAMAVGAPVQKALVQTAVRFVGRSRIEVDGRSYAPDCSGYVRGVYASQRVDLYGGLGELDGGNGVGRIYTHMVEHGRIHYGPTVHQGDLVFFHNTWDFNHDGYPNDPLTHVGVVEQVDRDGTVLFLSWVSGGIQRYRMNLLQPDVHKRSDGRVINDYLRRRQSGDIRGTGYLTGQLFAAFGTLGR